MWIPQMFQLTLSKPFKQKAYECDFVRFIMDLGLAEKWVILEKVKG